MSDIVYNLHIDLKDYDLHEINVFIDKLRSKVKIDKLENIKIDLMAQNPDLMVQPKE